MVLRGATYIIGLDQNLLIVLFTQIIFILFHNPDATTLITCDKAATDSSPRVFFTTSKKVITKGGKQFGKINATFDTNKVKLYLKKKK